VDTSPRTASTTPPDATGDSVGLRAVVELRIAGRAGPSFLLDPGRDNVLGRSTDAVVALPDRLASRSHAAVRHDGAEGWTIHDLGSRNGTWLDGTRITTGALHDGAVIRVGTSELVFRLEPDVAPPAAGDEAGRLVRCGPVGQFAATALRRSASGSPEDPRWPLLLYQAGIRLLIARSPREVIATTLELAAEHCGAAAFGWFRTVPAAPVDSGSQRSGGGRLEPVCVVPPGHDLCGLLGDSAARLILGDRKAVWISAGRGQTAASSAECDMICVPLVEHDRVQAMLAAAAPSGGLREADFDFLVALASLAAAAYAGRDPTAADDGGDLRDDSSLREAIAMIATIPVDDLRAAAGGSDLPAAGTFVLDAAAAAAALEPSAGHPAAAARISSFVAESATLRLEDWQRVLVVEALRRCGGSVPNAAAELGISRATLYRKLETYGLARSRG
jgi:pSer/pThr/pTyr-binding forkhead associated (FHA) protein